ncbi:hypothetical protein HL10_gp165 [Cronobacter phage CR8]|uniref:Uncharacterized protein n=2 Tax=Certrevirus TaxID=1914850 RepID=A0A060ACP7_9CAUD|nr:hypothetical protein HL10_gp165 [Cronobacter phage CR8]YP_009188872.1 hypothetical protein ADU18_0005 [Cronobacter phage PBES 02]AIA64695.1 hypothetical protein CR8_165 [Cronobacter phage CR8]AKY03911.1 hypothetical protein ADU18_0005 [Cronobacter phage PBES 02]
MNIEEMNAPHIIEDINGNPLALVHNIVMARSVARYWDRFLMVSTHIRLANEDDIAAFGRRLVDA